MSAKPNSFPSDFEQRLLAQTSLKTVERHATLGSTNAKARALAADPTTVNPTLVLTERQTSGRGRGTNAWWASKGSLTFSLLFDAKRITLDRPWLSLGTAIAVCRALESAYPEGAFTLKWPNDLLLDARKVCGVLIETISGPMPHVIIGVGVNVNNSLDEAPPSLRQSATSLNDVAARPFDLPALLTETVHQLFETICGEPLGVSTLHAYWTLRCALANQRISVSSGTKSVCGVGRGIDEQGALIIETDGRLQRLHTGSVSFV